MFLVLSARSGGPGASDTDGGTGNPQNDGAPAPADGDADVTLAHDVQPVFDTVCTRCHATRQPVLVSASAREALSGKSACVSAGRPIPYLVPGHPEQSFLSSTKSAARRRSR